MKKKIEDLEKDFIKRVEKIEELAQDSEKLKIKITDDNLQVKKELSRLICGRNEKKLDIIACKLLNNDLAMLTNIGIFIFHLNKSGKLIPNNQNVCPIVLDYFYHTYDPEESIKKINKRIGYLKVDKKDKDVRKDDINYDELIYGWVSHVKDYNEDFLKYGAALLMFAIELHDLELINDLYKKCLRSFEEDPENNKAFLSIITTSMPLLNKSYPEYVARYSSDTNMIIDSLDYKIEHLSTSHLYSFHNNIKIVDFTPSISWTKYTYKLDDMRYYSDTKMIKILIWLYLGIGTLIFYLTLPISFLIFYILNYFHLINEIYVDGFSNHYYKSYYLISKNKLIKSIKSKFSEKSEPTITFMIPYIKFVSYPQNYSWWRELFIPIPNPFVETINREIYKTWNGEALINFKWNLYGKYYYFAIWILFIALLGCFTAATTLSEDYDTRKELFMASIVLGFIHFIVEFRQFVYDPIEWIRDLWNFFGKKNNSTN